jgi:predicted flap endonuclease-1-like 5' DNA nuclease
MLQRNIDIVMHRAAKHMEAPMTSIIPNTDGLSKVLYPFASLTSVDLLQINPFAASPTGTLERLSDLQISVFENTMKLWLLPFSWTPSAAAKPQSAMPKPTPAPVAEPAPAPVLAAPPAARSANVVTLQTKAAPVANPAPVVTVAEPARAPVVAPAETAGEKTPALLLRPKGEPDDLERIVGIGPKLKKMLNDLGVWHFRQIAAWTPEEVSWVNTRIAFKGRIEREGWQKQATRLARGGAKAA